MSTASKGAAQTLKQHAQQQKAAKKRPVAEKMQIALQSAQIPRNEQLAMINMVDNEKKKKVQKYLACLVAPQAVMSRIPDSFARPTALVRSKQIINVPVNFSAGLAADYGRFAFCVNPSIGSLSGISKAKVAMIDSSNGWPQGNALTVPSYLTVVGGNDIRIDPFYTDMTQGEMGLVVWQASGASAVACTAILPFGTAPIQTAGYNLPVTYATNFGTTSIFYPPPGQYVYTFLMGATAVGTCDQTPNVAPVGGATVTFFASQQAFDNSESATSGYLFIPAIVGGTQAGISIQVSAVTNAIQNSQFILTRTFTDSSSVPSSPDHGITSQLRPVACSVLTTYTGPTLINGGMIAGAMLTGGASHPYFFDSNNPAGNCRNWENLSFLKGAYNGRLSEGSYVWWSPESLDDYQMKLPSAANSTDYPSIVVAGQFLPGATPAGNTVARVEITTVYEILTESLFLESQYQAGSQEVMDRTMELLAGQQHAMANATHMDWIKKLLGGVTKVAKFAVKNKDPLLSLGGDLLGLL